MTSQISKRGFHHTFNLVNNLKRRETNVESPCVREEERWGGAQSNKLVIGLMKYAQYIVIFLNLRTFLTVAN